MLNFFTKKPSKEYLQKLGEKPQFTQDLDRLEQSQYQLFFEYGELQDRMPKHQMIKPYFSTPACTVEKYGMLIQNVMDDPCPLAFCKNLDTRRLRRQKVAGELYAIKLPSPIVIDSYRQNGVQFLRKRVKVFIPEGHIHAGETNAWMYFALPSFWDNMISWDHDFYKGRESSYFREPRIFTTNDTQSNNHFKFTYKDLKDENGRKCFMYLKNGALSDGAQQQTSAA